MTISGKLSVSDGEALQGDTRLFVSGKIFDSLHRLIAAANPGDRLWTKEGKYDRSLQWEFVIGDEITKEVFTTIFDVTGKRPSPTVKRGPEEGFFFQVLRRKYSKVDLDSFEYFRVFPNRWIGTMGEREKMSDPVVVKNDKRLKKGLPIGFLDPHQVLAVGDVLRDALEGGTGAAFDPIRIEGTKRFSKIFLLGSETVLPPCLLDVVTALGEPYHSGGRGCLFEGGPFDVPELAYDRTEFPESEIAVTQELIGLSENDRFPIVVMAQSLRSKLLGLGIKGLDFSPVRLISKGEARWQDPWAEVFEECHT